MCACFIQNATVGRGRTGDCPAPPTEEFGLFDSAVGVVVDHTRPDSLSSRPTSRRPILTGGSETDSCTDSGGGSVTAQCEGGAPNACINGLEDGIETDTDCGGACSRCASGFGCRSAADCVPALYCIDSSCSSF